MSYLVAYTIQSTQDNHVIYTPETLIFETEEEAQEEYNRLLNFKHPDGDTIYCIQLCLIITSTGPLNI